jgi:hypothetical protein
MVALWTQRWKMLCRERGGAVDAETEAADRLESNGGELGVIRVSLQNRLTNAFKART